MARSTMARLFPLAIERHLHPLASRILELIREAEVVLADETPLGMQRKPDTGKAGKGYVWTFNADNPIAYSCSACRTEWKRFGPSQPCRPADDLATCAANGVNPLQNLTDILPRFAEHPNKRIDELLPPNWKPPAESDDRGTETAP